MDKVVRDGMVAVLVSPGFGAGWSTWGAINPFDPVMVDAIERGVKNEDLVALAKSIYPNEYHGGVHDLVVRWIPQGSAFQINEYDGSESLDVKDSMDWLVA